MSGRTLVIGLDGMPKSLLEELAAGGVVPRLAEVLAGSGRAELLAPVPEISSTSWATFLTGVNPARHGIFGFVDLVPGEYRTYFPNAGHLRAPALWEHAADDGLTTVCLNVPGTYPAPDIRGTVVSGFVAPRLDRAVRPQRLVAPLRRAGYELDVEIGDVAADPAGFLGRVHRSLRARTRAFRFLLAERPWDLAVAVFTETDRFQHFLWNRVQGGPAPEALDFYRSVDAAVGQLLDSVPDVTPFLVSDHGFGPAHCQFHVNAWLREQGLLAGLDTCPKLSAVDSASRVFALDPARFYVHREDRFPRGAVGDAEADELVELLAARLRALRWSGSEVGPHVDGPPLLDGVHLREKVYAGPHLDEAPDLVAVPARGVQLRGSFTSRSVTAPDVLTGTHTRDDAVFTVPGAVRVPRVGMADAAATVLAAAGVRVAGLDGADVARGRSQPTEWGG
ncbi:alkaline phosphatase family protein [Saccharopolyspora rosea]|uniref:alkaline phosphatase family protein n=1 Tax=Saccharopolyspora rosea TaxID=524884 RepID=UPI0021D92491|nr:alkaline phosphatase family protein [Saccharopolyspora rosea]